jgi:hypothetical protein
VGGSTAAKGKMEAQLMRAVTEKKPVPEIDFTLHTLEDNTQVSTQERVCKGNPIPVFLLAVVVAQNTNAPGMGN